MIQLAPSPCNNNQWAHYSHLLVFSFPLIICSWNYYCLADSCSLCCLYNSFNGLLTLEVGRCLGEFNVAAQVKKNKYI